MSLKAETHTFNQVKELLQIHENTLLNFFKSTVENWYAKGRIGRFKKSVQYDSENVDKASKKLEDINRTVEETKVQKLAVGFSQK